MNSTQHQLAPGQAPNLSQRSTRGSDFCDNRKDAEQRFRGLRKKLRDLQHALWAERRQKLLIVLQAMDAGGKDGTIRKVFKGVNPQGVHVVSFIAPTERELSHDFLWRVHYRVPPAGIIGVFNRSHYEDVVVVRVENLVPEPVWKLRYRQINDFERMLHETGTRILKFYLHISKEEQRERLQARLDEDEKHFKFSLDDLKKRDAWDRYQIAYEDALARCSSEFAPWYVIPADQKWYRNLAICEAIVETLEEMNPKFPAIDYDPMKVVIE